MKPGQEAGFCHRARCPAAALLWPEWQRVTSERDGRVRKGTAGPKGLTLSLSAYKSNMRQIKNTHIFLQMYFSMCTVTPQLK